MALSNAERQRRFIAKLKLWAGVGPDTPLPPGPLALEARVRKLEDENANLRRLLAGAEAHAPKLEAGKARPPVDPSSEVARFKARVRNLQGELREMKKWYDAELTRKGKMPLETFRAVIKCLHPTQREHMTAKQIDDAYGLFTQWKQAQDKAQGR